VHIKPVDAQLVTGHEVCQGVVHRPIEAERQPTRLASAAAPRCSYRGRHPNIRKVRHENIGCSTRGQISDNALERSGRRIDHGFRLLIVGRGQEVVASAEYDIENVPIFPWLRQVQVGLCAQAVGTGAGIKKCSPDRVVGPAELAGPNFESELVSELLNPHWPV
jgi:hypothetical protein